MAKDKALKQPSTKGRKDKTPGYASRVDAIVASGPIHGKGRGGKGQQPARAGR